MALTHRIGRMLTDDTHLAPWPFGRVADLLSGADLTLGNLECVTSQIGQKAIDAHPLRCPLAVLARLDHVGFDGLIVANNHALDFGRPAFDDSVQQIIKSGMQAIGVESVRYQPAMLTHYQINGRKVGFLAYYHGANKGPDDVAHYRRQVDFLVVYNHWGNELSSLVTAPQRDLATRLMAAGADLVVGAHTHVLQPTEQFQERRVVYGLGNFVFDAMPQTKATSRAALLEVELNKQGYRSRLHITALSPDGVPSIDHVEPWQDSSYAIGSD